MRQSLSELSSLLFLRTFALRFLFLQTRTTSYSFWSSVNVHCKGERRNTLQKTIHPSLWFKKSNRSLKSENSQYYAQKPQQNCTFMNSASSLVLYYLEGKSEDKFVSSLPILDSWLSEKLPWRQTGWGGGGGLDE
jgi:hypothetical protein